MALRYNLQKYNTRAIEMSKRENCGIFFVKSHEKSSISLTQKEENPTNIFTMPIKWPLRCDY